MIGETSARKAVLVRAITRLTRTQKIRLLAHGYRTLLESRLKIPRPLGYALAADLFIFCFLFVAPFEPWAIPAVLATALLAALVGDMVWQAI